MRNHLMTNRVRRLAITILVVGVLGCGESRPEVDVPTFPVHGKVVLAKGEPLTSGVVVFVSDAVPSLSVSGAINPDGTFSIMTDGVVPGAPAGDYRVRVEIDPDAAPTAASTKRRAGSPYPAKYAKESTSGLTATVKANSSNDLPAFELN